MFRRHLITLACVLAVASNAYADEEAARRAAHAFKEQYWECLASTAVQALPKKFSGQDFAYYVKGSCPDEAQNFRVAVVDYLALKFPNIDACTHLASANMVISAAQDDIVKFYIEQRR